MRGFLSILLLAGIMMFIVGMAYDQQVNAQDSTTQALNVTVDPTIAIAATWASGGNNTTIDLGHVPADNVEKNWPGGSNGEQVYTYSNIAIDVYTRASGNLRSGANNISIALLKYANYGENVAKTSFTTSYAKVKSNWAAPNQGSYLSVPVDLFLTVPFATPPGLYTTTIYHAAVQANATAPSSP